MFDFQLLTTLDSHISRLQNLLHEDLFLVGGVVRDALFGKETCDVDATGSFSPEEIRNRVENIQKSKEIRGLFRTEKYGTITVISDIKPRLQELNNVFDQQYIDDAFSQITYEITPFREEGGYDDCRHPSQICWSNSLVVDAGRRDFTINSIYYTRYGNPISPSKKVLLKTNHQQILDYLEKNGRTYLPGLSLLILQERTLIEKIFPQGTYDVNVATAFFASLKITGIDIKNIRILIDPMQGLHDMYIQKLRTVGEPDNRFNEDALRILRALRFVNTWNQFIPGAKYDFHKDTWESLKKNAALVQQLPKERIHQELVKVFSANNPFGYIALLDEIQVLQYLFPAVYNTKNNEQPVRYHPFDTYAHTLLTLWHLQQINTNYLVKLGMLYHDVGKPAQYEAYGNAITKEERNAIHSSNLNHIVSGPEYVKTDFYAIGFSTKEIEEIAWYVGEHMRPGQILETTREKQLKKLRTLYAQAGYDHTKNLLDICKADRLGQYNPLQGNEVDAVDILYIQLDTLRSTEGQFTKDQLAISGNDIMEYFHIPPGPEVGKMLTKAFDRVLHEKENRNYKNLILLYLQGLK